MKINGTLTIQYEDGSTQVIHPLMVGPMRFDGNWAGLAFHIGGAQMKSFDIS